MSNYASNWRNSPEGERISLGTATDEDKAAVVSQGADPVNVGLQPADDGINSDFVNYSGQDDDSSYTPPPAPTPAQTTNDYSSNWRNSPEGERISLGTATDEDKAAVVSQGADPANVGLTPSAAGSYAVAPLSNHEPDDMSDVITKQLTTSNQPQATPINPFVTTQKNTIKPVNNQQNITDFAVSKNGNLFNVPQNEDYAQSFNAKPAPDGLILTKPSDNRVIGGQPEPKPSNIIMDTGMGIVNSIGQTGETMFFNPKGEFDPYTKPTETGNIIGDLAFAGFEGAANVFTLGGFNMVKDAQRLYEYEQADGSGLDRAMSQITVGTSVLGAGSAVGLGLNVAKTGTASLGKSGLLTVGKEIASANKGQIFNVVNEGAIVATTTDPNMSSEDKLTTVGTSLILGGAFGAGTRAAGSVLPKVLGGLTKTKTVNTGGILTENTVSLWNKLNTPLIGGKSTIGKLVSPATTPITAPLTAMGGIYALDAGSRIAESDDKVRTATNIYTTELLPMVISAKAGYGLVSKISDTARDYLTTASFLKSSTGGKVKIGDVGKYIRENTMPETASDPMIALFDSKNLQHKNIVKSFELNKHYPDLPTNAPKGYTNEPSRSKAMTDILSTREPGARLLYHATPYGKSFKGDTTVGIGSSEQWGLYTASRPQSYYSKVDAYGKPTFSLFGNIPTKDPAIIGILGKDATPAIATKGIGKWSDLTAQQKTKINVDIYKQFEGVEPKSRIVEPNIKAEKEWVIQPNAILSDVPIQPQWYMVKGQRVPFRMKEITGTKSTTPEPTTSLKTEFGKTKERPSRRQPSSSSYREPSGDISLSNMLGTRSFTGSDSKKDGGYKSSSDYLPSSTKGAASSSVLGGDYSSMSGGSSGGGFDGSYIPDGSSSVRGGSSDIFGGDSSTRGGSSSTRGGSSSTRGGSSSTRGSSGGSSIQPYNPYIPTFPEIPRKKKDDDDQQKSKNRRENKGIMDFFEVQHREIATADQFSGGLFGGDDIQTKNAFYLGFDAFMSKNENGIRTSARKRTVKPAVKKYAKIRHAPKFDLGLGNLAPKSKSTKKGTGKGVNKTTLQFF